MNSFIKLILTYFFCIFFIFTGCSADLMNMKNFLSAIPPEAMLNSDMSPCVDGVFSPYCMAFCHENPSHESCEGKIDYCFYYPGSAECHGSCVATPFDPSCPPVIDCTAIPDDPACFLYCNSDPPPENVFCGGVNYYNKVSVDDSYTQVPNLNKVDMIWIMDNSSSMDDEQDDLANNFDIFINEFARNGADFRMGITTTDTTGTGGVYLHDGVFQGALPVLDSSMPEDVIKTNFKSTIKVGITGSFVERGLLAAEMAVQKNSDPTSANFNFLRNDAFLAIIIVSDENDISPNSTESYVNNILATKSDPSTVAIYPIVETTIPSLPDPYTSPIDMPLYIGTSPNPGGLRYINASNATSGFTLDIHDNFSTALFDIGGGILTLMNRYLLPEIPLLDSVVIKIDGIRVPHGEIDGWTYDYVTGAFLFHGTFIPAVDSVVEVSYEYLN